MLRHFVIIALAATAAHAQSDTDWNFYRTLNDGRRMDEMLGRFLRARAGELLDAREARVRNVTDWNAYRKQFREKLITSLGGPFPERTPLNATITGVVQRNGYRIEKVIFESQPKFYVTGNLYVPSTGRAPYPAILFPLGHEDGAKAHDAWQIVLANLALRGFVCFAWDPIGQGERIQIYDEDFQNSKTPGSTTEHTVQGVQTMLVGDAIARYTIHDGIRALDYLLSRTEVDPKRVGITGNSGGGTHTSYIASLEDRLAVAAPSCYLTSWRKLLDTIGPQDAEQCFPGWLAAGYDHPDFVYAFAPRPFLMLTAIRDFFPIGGARSTYAEGARVYDSLGASNKFAKVEADDGHGYTKPRREAAYRWFTQWLKGAEDTTPEHAIALASIKELNCTPTGQIATSLRGETIHTLNLARWKQLRKDGSLDDVRRLAAFTLRDRPVVRDFGSATLAGGVKLQKLVIEPERGVEIPAVLLLPVSAAKVPAVVMAHGRGKSFTREAALQFARNGEAVLSIDARGFGESAPPESKSATWTQYFGNYDVAMTAILIGRPLVGMRAEDISAAVSVLAARREIDAGKIRVHATAAAAIPALYATALDTRIASAELDSMLVSYEPAIRRRIHRRVFEGITVGALRYYDLPDLIRWSAPRRVKILSRIDVLGNPE
ncbi:MAG: acetylxylan esterase [Acidobacteria bacterium]|nr:acetylxylan esterase [Acidobacteriota bacterium]